MGWIDVNNLKQAQRNLTAMKKTVESDLLSLQRKHPIGQLIFKVYEGSDPYYDSFHVKRVVGYQVYNIVDYPDKAVPRLSLTVQDLQDVSSTYSINEYVIDPSVMRKYQKVTKKNLAPYLIHPNQNIREYTTNLLNNYKVR